MSTKNVQNIQKKCLFKSENIVEKTFEKRNPLIHKTNKYVNIFYNLNILQNPN